MISVTVPVFRCTPCLRPLCERVTSVMEAAHHEFEILLVDDRGGEGAWTAIEELERSDSRIRGLRMPRNLGQDAAIRAGLEHARGEWMAVLDCDLQDPPELIPLLLDKAGGGVFDVVFGRRDRKPTTLPRRLLASAYFRLLRWTTGSGVDGQFGPVGVLSASAAERVLALPGPGGNLVLLAEEAGLAWSTLPYRPAPRYAGRSSYSFPRLVENALRGGLGRAFLRRIRRRTRTSTDPHG